MSFRVFLVIVSLFATSATAAPRAVERRQFETAHQAAAKGPAGSWRTLARGLEHYPLYPYLEFAALTRDLNAAKPADVDAFLVAQQGSVLERDLRARWLAKLAREKRWPEFRKVYRTTQDVELRCHEATARIAANDTKTLFDDAKALWLTGRSLPTSCDPVVAWLKSQKAFGRELVWDRVVLAADAGQPGLIAHLATQLGPDRAAAQRWATVLANPATELAKVASWPDTARDRELAARAVAAVARRDATLASQRWAAVEQRYKLHPAHKAIALNAIALYKAASYEPDAASWLAKVPAELAADNVREWRVREALARRDFAATLSAIDALPDALKNEARFRYLRARMLEELGRAADAAPQFATLSQEANFHGFLAADRSKAPYAICPEDRAPTADETQAVLKHAAIRRAFELHELGWTTFARREWDDATREADGAFRRAAVAAAHARGWVDRGPLTLLKPEETRWYALRFPVAYEKEIRRGAKKHGLDASWVFALIRSESAWVADARSGADARGLMQLLPEVGQRAAKREKLPWRNGNDLYRPELNIALGTSHLADELRRHGQRVWLATAAYNAGPTPVKRWLAQRPNLPTDLWIETIPYKETREYVARVLAFSVLYDWRINGDAVPLGSRIALASGMDRRDVVCPVRTASTQP